MGNGVLAGLRGSVTQHPDPKARLCTKVDVPIEPQCDRNFHIVGAYICVQQAKTQTIGRSIGHELELSGSGNVAGLAELGLQQRDLILKLIRDEAVNTSRY